MNNTCRDEELESLTAAIKSGQENNIDRVDKLLATYPEDARLHFMKGSVCVGEGLLIEGHAALTRAIEIAPDFAIARFQLGFFQLTSGEPENAIATWSKLHELPDEHYLKTFVKALNYLIADEFSLCVEGLRAGILANEENEPLNNDMRLIISEVTPLVVDVAATGEDEVTSSTSFLLNQYSKPDTKH
jgi:tetratricopeptide (TPR) repeat protein